MLKNLNTVRSMTTVTSITNTMTFVTSLQGSVTAMRPALKLCTPATATQTATSMQFASTMPLVLSKLKTHITNRQDEETKVSTKQLWPWFLSKLARLIRLSRERASSAREPSSEKPSSLSSHPRAGMNMGTVFTQLARNSLMATPLTAFTITCIIGSTVM